MRSVNWLDRQGEPLHREGLIELGSVESPPMRDLAREVEKPSQNLYADLLLAHVGEKSRPADASADETSEDLGIRELNRFLAEAGIKRGEVVFEEGSGLSRDNLTTPHATVTLLRYMSRHKCAQAYLEALPIAGVDGTLRNRMKGTTGCRQPARQDRDAALGKQLIRPRDDGGGRAPDLLPDGQPLLRSPPRARRPGYRWRAARELYRAHGGMKLEVQIPKAEGRKKAEHRNPKPLTPIRALKPVSPQHGGLPA